MVIAYFKKLFQHLNKSTEEHDKSTSGRGCISTKYRVPEHDTVYFGIKVSVPKNMALQAIKP